MNRPLSTTTPDSATLYRPATLLYMAAMALMMVPVVTLVDIAVAGYFQNAPLNRDLSSALELSLVFSHGTGVFLVLMAILLLGPRLRWHVPRLATLALGGGAMATIAKMFVIRPRPSSLNLHYAGQETAWLWAFDWDLSQIAAFDSSTRAFPSGHVVTATALTIGLWIVLPRGRFLFATVWAGVMLQRLNEGSHFLSDVCGGVAFGLLWSYVCFHPKFLGNIFDKMAPEIRKRRRIDRGTDAMPIPAMHTNEPQPIEFAPSSELGDGYGTHAHRRYDRERIEPREQNDPNERAA